MIYDILGFYIGIACIACIITCFSSDSRPKLCFITFLWPIALIISIFKGFVKYIKE